MAQQHEPLPTHVTAVRFLSGVMSQVVHKRTLAVERLPTQGAAELLVFFLTLVLRFERIGFVEGFY